MGDLLSIGLQIFLLWQLFCLVSQTKWQLSQSLLPPPRFAEFNDSIGPRWLQHLALQIDSRLSSANVHQPAQTRTTMQSTNLVCTEAHKSKKKQMVVSQCVPTEDVHCVRGEVYFGGAFLTLRSWRKVQLPCLKQHGWMHAASQGFECMAQILLHLYGACIPGARNSRGFCVNGALPISEQDQLVSYHTEVREVEETIEKL